MLQKLSDPVFKDPDNLDIRYVAQLFGYSSQKALATISCPIIQRFLNRLDPEIDYIVDSRVHMLMPGWLPCIGGWHLDEVARDKDKNLDWGNNLPKQHYFMILDQNTNSLTEFINFEWPSDDFGIKLPSDYLELSKWIEKSDNKTITECESNYIYSFNELDAHRGRPATSHGWRFFIRATENTQRNFSNEIRRQTQVYIPSGSQGW